MNELLSQVLNSQLVNQTIQIDISTLSKEIYEVIHSEFQNDLDQILTNAMHYFSKLKRDRILLSYFRRENDKIFLFDDFEAVN